MTRRLAVAMRTDERGIAAVEFALIAPVMVLMLLGAVTYYVGLRGDYRSKRATYTIADIISRQSSVNDAFLAIQKEVFAKVALAPSSAAIRVTSVSRPVKALVVDWSYVSGDFTPAKSTDLMEENLPNIPVAGSALIVDSGASYTPIFGMFGSSAVRRTNSVVVRPRLGVGVAKTK